MIIKKSRKKKMTENDKISDDLKEIKSKLEGIQLTLKIGLFCLIILLSLVLWSILFSPSY